MQQDYDFFDLELRGFINTEWQRASRILHHYLSRARNTTGNAYLLWRLKLIALGGEMDVQEELKKMKNL
jgi:hypothetical protein